MRNYMFGKVSKWAAEDCYFEILSDENKVSEIA